MGDEDGDSAVGLGMGITEGRSRGAKKAPERLNKTTQAGDKTCIGSSGKAYKTERKCCGDCGEEFAKSYLPTHKKKCKNRRKEGPVNKPAFCKINAVPSTSKNYPPSGGIGIGIGTTFTAEPLSVEGTTERTEKRQAETSLGTERATLSSFYQQGNGNGVAASVVTKPIIKHPRTPCPVCKVEYSVHYIKYHMKVSHQQAQLKSSPTEENLIPKQTYSCKTVVVKKPNQTNQSSTSKLFSNQTANTKSGQIQLNNTNSVKKPTVRNEKSFNRHLVSSTPDCSFNFETSGRISGHGHFNKSSSDSVLTHGSTPATEGPDHLLAETHGPTVMKMSISSVSHGYEEERFVKVEPGDFGLESSKGSSQSGKSTMEFKEQILVLTSQCDGLRSSLTEKENDFLKVKLELESLLLEKNTEYDTSSQQITRLKQDLFSKEKELMDIRIIVEESKQLFEKAEVQLAEQENREPNLEFRNLSQIIRSLILVVQHVPSACQPVTEKLGSCESASDVKHHQTTEFVPGGDIQRLNSISEENSLLNSALMERCAKLESSLAPLSPQLAEALENQKTQKSAEKSINTASNIYTTTELDHNYGAELLTGDKIESINISKMLNMGFHPSFTCVSSAKKIPKKLSFDLDSSEEVD